MVPRAALLLTLQVHLHLRTQRSLRDRPLQIPQNLPLPEHFPRILPPKKLIQQLLADPLLRSLRHLVALLG